MFHEELLKSAELTGIWEKKLREIEKKNYEAKTFLEELKQMVTEVVNNVLSDNTNRHITIQNAVKEEVKKEPKKREKKAPAPKKPKEEKPVPEENKDNIIGQPWFSYSKI